MRISKEDRIYNKNCLNDSGSLDAEEDMLNENTLIGCFMNYSKWYHGGLSVLGLMHESKESFYCELCIESSGDYVYINNNSFKGLYDIKQEKIENIKEKIDSVRNGMYSSTIEMMDNLIEEKRPLILFRIEYMDSNLIDKSYISYRLFDINHVLDIAGYSPSKDNSSEAES